MAEIKQGDRIVWARSNDGAEQTGQVAAVRPNGVKLTNGEYVPFGQIVAPHLDVPAPEAEAGGKAGVGKCATEGCGKPLAHKQARYCPDGARYRADFLVAYSDGKIEVHEVKGSHTGKHLAWSEAGVARFRAARALLPWMTFRLMVQHGDIFVEEMRDNRDNKEKSA